MALGRDLSDDLVADVLRRLPPRSLVVCRCVCRAWRDFVDDDDLRAVLLPRSVGGIFINYTISYTTDFLARPTLTGPSISGDLELINPAGIPGLVADHCNGLVLYTDFSDDRECLAVANPATRQWARLPLPPPEPEPDSSEMGKKKSFIIRRTEYLVYDPTVSPHYHVFLIDFAIDKDPYKSALQQQGYVCSSETWRWEERWFVPESCDMVETTTAIDVDGDKPKVYWRGKLYLLCKNGFVLRISISTAIYTLIPSPADRSRGSFLLGRSEKGVYCAFEHDKHRLEIFLLNESCGSGQTAVWELKHSVDLKTFALKLHARSTYSSDRPNGPWILEDIDYYKDPAHERREVVEEKFEWNSDDDDNALHIQDMVEGSYAGYTDLTGFHPYKEVVFLNADLSRAVAYHWNTSKFQDLGNICPTNYHNISGPFSGIDTSFIYTPCWMADFPENSLEAPIEDSDSVQATGSGSNIE